MSSLLTIQMNACVRKIVRLKKELEIEIRELERLATTASQTLDEAPKLKARLKYVEDKYETTRLRARPAQIKANRKRQWHVTASEMLNEPAWVRDAIKPGGLIG